MKNAEIWKLMTQYGLANAPIEIADIALEAPIVVDSRPFGVERGRQWNEGVWFCLPFSPVWIEGPSGDGGGRIACLVSSFGKAEDRKKIRNSHGIPANSLSELIDNMPGTQINIHLVIGGSDSRLAEGNFYAPSHIGHVTICLDDDGKLIDGHQVYHGPKGLGRESIEAILSDGIHLTLDVLAMLSCKNVSLAPREVHERSKFACKRHGGEPHPSFRYHVLVVKPPGASPNHPGEEIGTMPRHVCRGHFREYSEDRPLFGRAGLFGRFFIPPHMKGDKKNGVVEKDYEVRATA